MQIYQALDWQMPIMAHIPLIHGADGAKLSKRHGALGIDAYRAMGYLPAALRNYLVRLGWSHGDKEFFTTEAMIETFDLAHVGRSPARFDFLKLENMNGHYLRASRNEDLVAALVETWPHLPDRNDMPRTLDARQQAKLLAAMPGLKERAKTLLELRDGAAFLFAARPLALDDQAASILEGGGRAHLAHLLPRLADLRQWTPAATEAVVRNYAEEMNLKLGQVAQPLRAPLTGRATSPGIFEVFDVLGREESLGRLQDQLP